MRTRPMPLDFILSSQAAGWLFPGARRPMLLDFTAPYFTYGLFIGPSFHSSTFSLIFSSFLRRISSLANGAAGAVVYGNPSGRMEIQRHSYVLVSCDVFPLCLLGLHFLLCPAASVRGLDTLRCHELIGLSSVDSTPCSFVLTN